jgi:pimeloyl-ACP methyl ester carboxylesterase
MAVKAEIAKPRKSRVWRVFKWLMLVFIILLLGFIFGFVPYFLSSVILNASSRPSDRVSTETPATYGCTIFQDVTFSATDGAPISAWYLPPSTQNAKGIDIVVGHGLFRSRYETLERGARLWKLGYGVLIMDMRHHGKSGGQKSSFGYFERYDFEGALKYLKQQNPNSKVAFLGVSMSAAAELLAAAESDQVMGVIADSTFLNFNDVVTHHADIIFRVCPGISAFSVPFEFRSLTSSCIWFRDAAVLMRRISTSRPQFRRSTCRYSSSPAATMCECRLKSAESCFARLTILANVSGW